MAFATAALVFWGNRLRPLQEANSEASWLDYLLMGRKLTLPLFVGTLVATWYGGIFGVTQIAFEDGIYNFLIQGAFWYVTYIFFALFLVDKIRRYEAITLPNLVHKMVGPKSGIVAALFNLANVIPITYAISIGLLLQSLIGVPLSIGIIFGVCGVQLYSLAGGFRAVVFSDFAQFISMCIGVALVLAFSISTFGGIEYLQSTLPASHFYLLGNHSFGTTLVWGFIALSTLVDPNFYQRCFAANSARTAKVGILLSTVVWFVFDICTTLGGMYARAVLPDADSSTAYLLYALQILPEGLRGFFIAGILATILSTLDSYLFVAGSTLVHDLGPKRWRKSLLAHKFGILLIGAVAILLSLIFDGNIREIWKTLGSYSAACLLFPLLFAYWNPGRITDRQFLPATIIGAFAMTFWRLVPRYGVWASLDEFYIGLASTLIILFLWPQKRGLKNPPPYCK